ncbi:MAG: DUF4317 domain-containing protein [Ruminococcaceae bacterium]|nr:DUF4317 domain-containing protein [Oscillospiraceae bacterium]
MNEKEIGEIRRRFSAAKSNINHIRGCCVSTEGQILSEFDQSLAFLTEDEIDKILGIIRKTLSGYVGRNLSDIEFSTKQVLESAEHKALMDIRDSDMNDDEAVHELYKRIIESLEGIEDNYIIMLASDKYDVPSRRVDGEKGDDSNEIFRYFVCCICPIKTSRSQLGFYISGNPFRSVSADTVVTAPELGFMFPCFDDRSTNIYKALFYTKSTQNDYSKFIDTLFKSEVIPLPADIQKETFNTIVEKVAEEQCNLHVVKTLHNQLNEMILEHKEQKVEEPLFLDKNQIVSVLESSGLEEKQISEFRDKFDTEFGEKAQISPRNVVETKQFRLKTPDVVIKVDPKRTDLIKTRVIDGEKYILISAEGDIEVNGINISIT